MANIKKLAKGLTSAIKGTQDVLPAAERQANLAKMLEQSVVKDRLYHGTKSPIKSFDLSKRGSSDVSSVGGGIYLTPDPNVASFYSKIVPGESGSNVMPVHAQVKNPFEYDLAMPFKSQKDSNEFSRRLQEAGYDSIIKRGKDGEIVELVVFDPNKIKSATGNRGTYDVTKPDINESKGGRVKMAAGGLGRLAKTITKETAPASRLTKEEIKALRASGMGVPDIDFADPLVAPRMRMSEALGNTGSEGKTLNFTEADRSRVFGPNRGGVGFSALQNYSEPHKNARTVWGFGNKTVTEKKIKQNDPDKTVWTTYAGSPEQHKSNTVVVKDAIKTLQEANKKGAVHPEQLNLINQRIREAKTQSGNPLFPEGFDITDPQAMSYATTFDRRAAISDALMGLGVKGPMVSKEFKKANPGVKWEDASDINRILTRETDPALAGANTFDVGPHLFIMDNKIIHRPDLNEAFPFQVTGEDLGMRFKLAPIKEAAPEFMKKKGYGPNDPVNAWAMSRGNPSQFISEEYLTNLQKAGYQEGGEVSSGSWMDRLKAALEPQMAEGGEVSWQDRLKAALEQRMADGGEVSDNTLPDMTDSGSVDYAESFSEGGAPQSPEETVTAPVDRQVWAKVMEKGKKALENEFSMLKNPKARADILKRIGLTAAGTGPDLLNLLASGVDLVQEQIPGLRKKVPESVMSEVMPMAYRRPSSYAPKFPLASEEMPGGSEHQIRNAKEAGLLGEYEAPIIETVASLAAPFAVGPALKAVKAAPRAAKSLVNEMVTPMSPRQAQRGAIGWHGTPHKFPPTEKNPLGEFDPTKIGSGEGAQVYGHGHYTAEAPETAKSYRETLRYKAFDIADEAKKRGFELNAGGRGEFVRQANAERSPEEAAKYLQYANIESRKIPREKLAELISDYRTLGKGNLYKVDIPDEQVAKMLDLDKPVSEQPFKLQSSVFNDMTNAGYDKAFVNDLLNRKTGMDLYKTLVNGLQQGDQRAVKLAQDLNLGEQGMLMDANALTSQVFKKMGIPGIKYLDQQSRGASGTGKWLIKFKDGKEKVYDFKPNDDVLQSMGATAEPTGTRNFVVFPGNESMMNIVERHKRGGLAQAKG